MRDYIYWRIYQNVKKKHPDWPVNQIHKVAAIMRAQTETEQ